MYISVVRPRFHGFRIIYMPPRCLILRCRAEEYADTQSLHIIHTYLAVQVCKKRRLVLQLQQEAIREEDI